MSRSGPLLVVRVRLALVSLTLGAASGCGSRGGSSRPVEEHPVDAEPNAVMSDGDGGKAYNVWNKPNPRLLRLMDAGSGTNP